MKNLNVYIATVAVLLSAMPPLGLFAEETQEKDIGQIVVTARQLPESIAKTAHSIQVVTGQQMDERLDRNVAEGIRELPGVVVQTLGTRGESVNVRIRGGTNGDTLVLLDGVRLNNPATNETNLSLIPVEQIDRIDVLSGSQAVLYGGSAVGGVVSIFSQAGGDETQVRLSGEGGNLGHAREWFGVSGSNGVVRFNLGGSRTDESGSFANDYFGETALTQRWDFQPIDGMNLEITSHILLSTKHLAREFLIGPAPLYDPALPMEAFFLQLAPDFNRLLDRLVTTESLRLTYDWNDTFRTEMLYGFFLSDEQEKNSNIGDPGFLTPSGILLAPNSVLNDLRGQRNSVDLRQYVFLPKWGPASQTLTAGFEFYDERVSMSGMTFPGDPPPPVGSLGPFIPPQDTIPAPGIPGDRQNYAPYFQYHLDLKNRLGFDAGFRWDQNSDYGGEFSPRVAFAVFFPEINGKLHGAYGEGFLPPTPLQLFNPISGNPNLEPQTSQSYEAGYEQRFGSKAFLFANFFYLDFDNLISRLGANTEDALATGLEAGFTVIPIPRLNIGANYTFTHTLDESGTQLRIPNVPTHVFNATLNANPWRTLNIASTLSVVSDSREAFPLVSTDGRFVGGTPAASLAGGINDGYSLWDIAISYLFSLPQPHPRAIKVFGKAANILNQEFEAVFGFPNPGFHFFSGAEILF